MATYDLKYPGATIDAILDTAYDLQNAGYIFRGLASEYSNTPTERSWVLAGEGETGHGFTSPVPKGYIGVCVFNGTSWTGKLLKCVSIDSTPTNGSTNAVSSGGTYTSISQLASTVNEALDNLTFTDSTPSAFLGEYITEKVSTTDGGIERILTYFTILAATAEKAGLLSAADKQKLDAILGNLRSLKIDDTTAYADMGDKIVESIKATIWGTEETISTFQILAATASKAGLLSAADKAKLDALWTEGYKYIGIATPETTPVSTTSKIFYIATEAGTYFNAVTVTQGINILSWDGTAWSAVQVVAIDDGPTPGSKNIVESGGVEESVHTIEQKINNLLQLTPIETVDGKIMLHDGEHENEEFEYRKYAISPNTHYFFSGVFTASTNIKMVYVYDSSDNFIASYGDYDTEHGVTYKDERFIAPEDAAYAYLNVHKIAEKGFGFAEYAEQAEMNVKNMLNLKVFSPNLVDAWEHYFYNNRGLVANNNMAVFKFKVEGGRFYRFSGKFPAGTNTFFMWFSDVNDEYITYAGSRGSLDSEIVIVDELVQAPGGAGYAYLDAHMTTLDYAKFEVVDINDVVFPMKVSSNVPMTPTEVVDNSFIYKGGGGSNNGFQIWKYDIDPNKVYVLNGWFNNANIPFGVFVDSGGNIISNLDLSGALNTRVGADNYIIVPPPNATKIYINYYKLATFSLAEKGDTTDRTVEVTNMLRSHRHCKLGAGMFYVNGIDMPAFSTLEGCGNATTVVLSGDSDGYAVRLSKYCKVKNIRFVGAFDDLNITEPSDLESLGIGNRHGILFLGTGIGSDVEGNAVEGCEFRNFTGGGVTLDNTGYSTKTGLVVSNCKVRKCGAGVNIAYFSEFNKFTAVEAHDCAYGVVINGGNNSFVNCDFSSNGVGIYYNGNTNKAVRYDGTAATATNTAHGLMTGCTINHSGFSGNDTPGYAIVYLDTVGGFLFTGLQIHYGKIKIRSSEAVQFDNVRFGYNTKIEATSNRLIVISNITVLDDYDGRKRLRIYAYTNADMDTIDTAYLTDGNLQKMKVINSYLPNGNAASVQALAGE